MFMPLQNNIFSSNPFLTSNLKRDSSNPHSNSESDINEVKTVFKDLVYEFVPIFDSNVEIPSSQYFNSIPLSFNEESILSSNIPTPSIGNIEFVRFFFSLI
jgi:hypothetical protein